MTNEQLIELNQLAGHLIGRFSSHHDCPTVDVIDALENILSLTKQTIKTNRI